MASEGERMKAVAFFGLQQGERFFGNKDGSASVDLAKVAPHCLKMTLLLGAFGRRVADETFGRISWRFPKFAAV